MKSIIDCAIASICLLSVCLMSGCGDSTNRDAGSGDPLHDLNVVLLVVDTLGAEHVGCYNDAYDHTPNIDRLAAGGVRFTNSFAAAPWTKPSLSSMFTGLMPGRHGIKSSRDVMPDGLVTLAEHYKRRGYATAGVISHIFITPKYGYAQGFDDYTNVNFKGPVHTTITSGKVTKKGMAWLEKHRQRNPDERFFLFLHYFDPHFYYQHHPRFDRTSGYEGELKAGMDIKVLRAMLDRLTPEDVDYLVGLHHEEIAFTDRHIGNLIKYLEGTGLMDNTLVVLVSDHGEEFMRHGWIGHTKTLYDELIRVPLIFYYPKALQPAVIDYPVAHIDLMPTLLSMFDEPVEDPAWEGKSLLPLLRDAKARDAKEGGPVREIYAEVDFTSADEQKNASMTAVHLGPYKLIHDRREDTWNLFDLSRDPEEFDDLSKESKVLFKNLKEKVTNYERWSTEPSRYGKSEAEIDEDERKKLESLGYL